MKKLYVMPLMIALAAIAIAADARAINTDLPAPPAIGATIVDFTLPDVDGKDHSLSSLKGKNGTVLIFIAVQCPVSSNQVRNKPSCTTSPPTPSISTQSLTLTPFGPIRTNQPQNARMKS